MSTEYESLSKEALIEILKRRDARATFGLVWEKDEIDADRAVNRDFVGLEPDPALSFGAGPYRNLVIEGDNYDALRNLVSAHAGQVHLIYIDPPYNTGRRDFVYNDSYFEATDRFRHSTWLEFMSRRLQLAKDLLRDDGVIFVSIDDNELFALGMLMNQVFGEQSFVANCVWQKRYSRENREAIGDAHEYLLVYSPDPAKFKARRGRIALSEEQAKVYKNPDNPKETDPSKRWQSISLSAPGYRPNQMYKITAPNGTEHYPPEGRCWGTIESEFLKLREAGRITFGKDGNGVPRIIRYLSDVEGLVPWTWWPHEEVGHTDEARKHIQDIFGTQTAFDTPKPVRLLERVLQIGAPEKDALVVDFFAGSGTTGHAVLKMNQADGGDRRFILVSSTEATAADRDRNVCRDVCRERLAKVIGGYTSAKNGEVPGIPGHFAYLRTRHVPVHRLEEKLSDAMAWTYIQMRHGLPLRPLASPLSLASSLVAGVPFSVAYLATTNTEGIAALERALIEHPALLVYTWTPAAVARLLPENNIRSIPADLVRTFRFGHLPPREQE